MPSSLVSKVSKCTLSKKIPSMWSAVYRLNKDGTGLEFLLFPMIHVSSKESYTEISKRLSTCDLILTEGVKSKSANILTLSYRIVKKIRRMDLITQHDGIKVDGFNEKILNADMEERAFEGMR